MSLSRRLFVLAAVLLLVAAAVAGSSPVSAQEVDDFESVEAEPIVEFAPWVDPDSAEAREAAAALASAADGAQERAAREGVANIDVDGVTVTYDPANPMPANARAVVERAVADWASNLETGSGLVEVLVSWVNTGSPNILASAGPTQFFLGNPGSALPDDSFTPAPLANVLVGGDIQPTAPEIEVTVNADFNWYIGTTGNPTGSQFDLYTVMLHELGHGFGFVGSGAGPTGGSPTLNDPPFGFDTHVFAGNGPLLDNPDPNAQLTGDNLFFNLPTPPRYKLFAPATWQQGSSYSHFDEATYGGSDPGTLMTPQIAPTELIRRIDAPELGLMERIGWTLTGGPPADPGFTALTTPCVLHDSTSGSGGFAGPIGTNATRTIQATGSLPAAQGGAGSCAPSDATAVMVTISAVAPSSAGNFRLSAAGATTSGGVVNYTSNGLNNANTVSVPVSASGQLDIFANAAASGVRVTMLGHYSPSGTLRYNGLTPCAAADSRSTTGATGGFVGPFAAGAAYPDVDVVGSFAAGQGGGNTDCGVPASADAVMVNLVSVGGSGGQGFLSAASGGLDPSEPMTPFADINLNNATAVVVPLTNQNLSIDIESVSGSPSSHVRVVVLGYFDDAGNDFNPVNACAAFDTRPGQGASGGFLGRRVAGNGGVTTYQISGTIPSNQGGSGGNCGVPNGASAVLINLVGIQPNAFGNFRAYATGTSPTGGVLNWSPLNPAMNNSNAVVVPLDGSGRLSLFTNAPAVNGNPTVHARGVVLGYYD